MRFIAVLVTYGERGPLVEEACRRALAEGCVEVVVVSNGGNAPDVKNRIMRLSGADRIRWVHLPENAGSQIGFQTGLELASGTDLAYDYVLLLDDDNHLEAGALREASRYLRHPLDSQPACAVLHRDLSALHARLAAGELPRDIVPPTSSFAGFDLARSVKRRLPKIRTVNTVGNELPRLEYSGYGGLLIPAPFVQRALEAERPDYVLYEDDAAMTLALTRSGIDILFLPTARIHESDGKWTVTEHGNPRHSLLAHKPAFRSYYQIRNRAHFDLHLRTNNRLRYALNRFLFLSLLHVTARRNGWIDNYRFIKSAVRDGEKNRLGTSDRFPLPE